MNEAESPRVRSTLEWLARHDRIVVLAAIAVVVTTAFFVMLHAGDAAMMAEMTRGNAATHAFLVFVMWWAMMVAMMLPSALPAILIYSALLRKQQGADLAQVAIFTSGYVAIWTAFSTVAVALQLLLRPGIDLDMSMAVTSAMVGALLLIAAGLYQLTPLKQSCLKACQSPQHYFGSRWRKGRLGAFRMGVRHGLFCLGCCWVLMGLLFYGGVMATWWIIGLALYVAAEKLIPADAWLARFSGVILIAAGAYEFFAAQGWAAG